MLDDIHFMNLALELARSAAAAGEIPVGALVVQHGPAILPVSAATTAAPPAAPVEFPRIIGRGFNRREALCDPSAHAEIVALREAGTALGHWRLLNCTLYVTLEPCPMCAGAIVNARLPRLVYAAADPKAGAVHTLYKLCSDVRLNHRVEVVSGVQAAESAALLREFFQARRARGSRTPLPGENDEKD